MNLLIIGITLLPILILIPIVIHRIVKNSKSKQDPDWLKQHGKLVIAQVTDVKPEQGWRYEDRLQWNAWEGRHEQARTWRTLYTITAVWTEPQTKVKYPFCLRVWADELVSMPNPNSSVPVLIDPRNPACYYVDLKVA